MKTDKPDEDGRILKFSEMKDIKAGKEYFALYLHGQNTYYYVKVINFQDWVTVLRRCFVPAATALPKAAPTAKSGVVVKVRTDGVPSLPRGDKNLATGGNKNIPLSANDPTTSVLQSKPKHPVNYMQI